MPIVKLPTVPDDALAFSLISPDVNVPRYHTAGAAAFDVGVYLQEGVTIEAYDENGKVQVLVPNKDPWRDSPSVLTVRIQPGWRVKLPTGLSARIPSEHHIELRGRSSAFKHTLRLCNGVGTLDSDYRGEWFISVDNISRTETVVVPQGERLAQAILNKTLTPEVVVLPNDVTLDMMFGTTERGSNGFGSTGS